MKQRIIAGLIGIAGLGIISETVPHFTRDKYLVKVTGMERVTSSDTDSKGNTTVDSKYVVFTKDAKTGQARAFQNTDTLLECAFGSCKFNSSDMQAQLADAKASGKTVEVSTYGWRIPIFSSYKNIVSVTDAGN